MKIFRFHHLAAGIGVAVMVAAGSSVAAFAGSPPPPAANAYVSTHGVDVGSCLKTAPCATINYAIGVAPLSGIVSVAAGTYDQTVSISKSVSVLGAGANNTIINGVGTPTTGPDAVVNVLTTGVSAGPIQVSGFTITNPVADTANGGEPFAVVLLDKNASDTITISNNIITEGSADSASGTDFPVGIWGYHSAPTGNTVISGNTISGFFQGALLEDNGPVTVTGNTFQNLISNQDTSTTPSTVYPAEGLFFLSDLGTSLTGQNASGNVFRNYAGIGVAASAGYGTSDIGSINGAITNNSFDLQGATGAAAIDLLSNNAGSNLTTAVDGNTGHVTSPSDAIDVNATNGGTTSISEQNDNITSPPSPHGPPWAPPPMFHGSRAWPRG
jgi:hypothetical protein